MQTFELHGDDIQDCPKAKSFTATDEQGRDGMVSREATRMNTTKRVQATRPEIGFVEKAQVTS